MNTINRLGGFGSRLGHILGLKSSLMLTLYLFGSTFTQSLTDWAGKIGTVILLAVLGIFALILTLRTERKMTSRPRTASNTSLASRKGLVVLVGLNSHKASSPVIRLLKEAHGVTHIAFIGTPQTEERGVVREIRSRVLPVIGRDLPSTQVFVSERGAALSLADFRTEVTSALQWMANAGLEPSEVLVDTTEGRRAMGYGALEAANNFAVDVQYLADDEEAQLPRDSQNREFVIIKNSQQ